MASKSIFTCVIFLVVLCLLLTRKPSDCSSAYGCLSADAAGLKGVHNRKALAALQHKKPAIKTSLQSSSSGKNSEKSLTFELRKVPSGPDPLHHNGGSPKRPRTP